MLFEKSTLNGFLQPLHSLRLLQWKEESENRKKKEKIGTRASGDRTVNCE